MNYDAIIIGGGIAGLSAAWELQKQSPNARALILESASRLGGKIRTDSIEDCTIEAGADSFLMRKPWAVELCRELGIADRLIPTNQSMRRVYVLRKNHLHPLPQGLRLIIPTDSEALRASQLLSPQGCERMLAEEEIPPAPASNDESVASFVRRRFGQECLDVLAQPMLAGLFVGDADTLSLAATFPEYLRMEQEYGSLIRAARQRPPAATSAVSPNPVAGMFASLPGGMQELLNALETQLTCEIRLNHSVQSIQKRAHHWQVSSESGTVQASNLIIATPMRIAGKLLRTLDTTLSGSLEKQRYASSATISLAYDRAETQGARELDGYGVVIPKIENKRIAAMSWTSTKIPSRAPKDRILLRIFLGGDNIEQQLLQPDSDLVRIASEEVAEHLGITASPAFSSVYRYANATPRFDLGHVQRVDELYTHISQYSGLTICGCDYRGFGIPDTVKNAREAVRSLDVPV